MFCKNCGNQIPDGVAFCAACGTAVAAAPAAPAAPAVESYAAPVAPAAPASILSNKSNLVKIIAAAAAAIVFIVLIFGLLGGGNPKSMAKKYVEAELTGDMKAGYKLMAGKMQKLFEESVEDEDQIFELYEGICDEADIDVKINNFNQLYKAMEKLYKAQNEEQYGKNFKLKVKVMEVEKMNSKEIKEIKESIKDDEDMEDYIDASKIKKGKIVTVRYNIDGSEDAKTEDVEVCVVKYKGKWKVISE